VRTTVTIDPDVEALLKRAMRDRGLSFKDALNSAIRAGLLAGLAGRRAVTVKVPTFDMKQRANLNLDRALALAGELEDEELIRKLSVGK